MALIFAAGGSVYAYERHLNDQDITQTATSSALKTFSDPDKQYSFEYPSNLFAASYAASPGLVTISTSATQTLPSDSGEPNPSPGQLCIGKYLITVTPATAFNENTESLAVSGSIKSALRSVSIDGHSAAVAQGLSDGKGYYTVFAPIGTTVNLAEIQNGNNIIQYAACGANQNTAEFNQILSSFKLFGSAISAAATPITNQK